METPIGLFIEVTGIQDYIFSSNKLRLSLGASYIIEHLLMDELLLEILNEISGERKEKVDEWQIDSVEPEIGSDKIKIGYNGGGNCLLFCNSAETAKAFIDQFSLKTMLNFPGINLAATTLPYDRSDAEILKEQKDDETFFQAFMTKMNSKLSAERSKFHVISNPISPGYVRKDTYSFGYVDVSASKGEDTFLKAIDGKNTSVSTLSKLKQVENAVARHNSDFLGGNQKYSFPSDFEDVCMEDDQGFIAVVHIDGNGIGSQFMQKKTLKDFQELSKRAKLIGQETVRRTVKDLIGLIEQTAGEGGLVLESIKRFSKKNAGKQNIPLPFRPIISGGDDITFVTDGRLGIYLAKKCVENFIKVTKEKLGEEFHACAGVAIVKRKYPFIRAYHLAEELIGSAKKASRADAGKKYSYMDMYISNSGVSGSLDSIRKQTHERMENGNKYLTYYGPYLIATNQPNTDQRHTLSAFIGKMEKSLGSTSLSKVQQLRAALYGSTKDREAYLNRIKEIDKDFYKQLKLGAGGDPLFEQSDESKETPWIDAIDYRDFYPLGFKEEILANEIKELR